MQKWLEEMAISLGLESLTKVFIAWGASKFASIAKTDCLVTEERPQTAVSRPKHCHNVKRRDRNDLDYYFRGHLDGQALAPV